MIYDSETIDSALLLSDPNEMRSLSLPEATFHIRAVLVGEAAVPSTFQDELPHVFLERAYRQQSAEVREVFRDAMVMLLEQAVLVDLDQPPEWVDELLLLVPRIATGTDAAKRIIHVLLHLVAHAEPNATLHFRTLAALVSLGYRGSPGFWKNAYQTLDERFAQVVIRGLALWHLDEIFTWLGESRWSPQVVSAFNSVVPLLLEEYGAQALEPRVGLVAARLIGDAKAELLRICASLGLRADVGIQTLGSESALELQLESWSPAATLDYSRDLFVEAEAVCGVEACSATLDREVLRAVSDPEYFSETEKRDLAGLLVWYVDRNGPVLQAEHAARFSSVALTIGMSSSSSPEERIEQLLRAAETSGEEGYA